MYCLRQSTASQEVMIGPFVDNTDFLTPETGLTIANTDIKIFKAGATADANKNSGGATHVANGRYYIVLDATDTNTLGSGEINVSVAGALPCKVHFCVLPANVFDSMIAGSDVLDVSVTQFGGTNGTFSGGRPEVNTTHAAGTAWGSGAITAGSIAGDAITAAKLASDAGSEIATAVWANGTRVLTAGTNIVLAKGTGVTGFNDLSAAQVNSEVDTAISDAALATATNLATVAGYLDTEIAAILADTNELQTDWANGGRLDLILDARASQTSVDTIDGIVDSILIDTAEIGAAGAGLTAVPWNASWDAEVQSECADALNAYDPPTNAEMTARTLATADYATATALATVDTVADAIKVVTDKLDTMVEADGDDFKYTAAALIETPAGEGGGLDAAGVRAALGMASANLDAQLGALPTAAENADAVWDEAIAGHVDSGSTGAALGAAGSAGDPWETSLPGAYGDGTAGNIIGNRLDAAVSTRATQTSVDAVQADTEDIQARLPDALVDGRMDASVGGMAANTVTASALASDAVTEMQSGLATAAGLSAVEAKVDTLDTVADGIAAKTVNLPSDPADQSLVIAATTAIYDRIGAPAGASVSADVAAVKADTAAVLADTGTDLPAALDALATPADVASALATYDGPTKAELDAGLAAIELTGTERTAIANALLDLAAGVESDLTVRQALRLILANAAGNLSGAATTTNVLTNPAGTKDRITAAVDSDGNRMVTVDVS